ncbi:vanadium-dependent haloperoxidase [Alsobacter sp. KACC 23698]|uniref:Vanadium-dependent haloperoxidase n=1 Tax=Alsobacter sp. KACC 23698 TaxID=3149229 RepID=A0AAU7JJN0_9HYPH
MVMSCMDVSRDGSRGAQDAVAGPTNPVLLWATHALEALQADGSVSPTVATRMMAMESIAVLDVVNAVQHAPGFLASGAAPSGMSEAAAIAASAAYVLEHAMPGQKALIEHDLQLSLAGVPDGKAQDAGVAFGRAVAAAVVEARADDGWDAMATVSAGDGEPGTWRPTLPNYAAPVTPQWGDVAPFMMKAGDAFRPDGPPALDSAEYAAALNEVKELGGAHSTLRTADQTELARFWANDAGAYTAPGHLDHIAIDIAQEQGLTSAQSAQLLAELNVAMADAAIAAWDAKGAYEFWRPIDAIRLADTDGNPATSADPTWTPLLPTPSHPEYPSGHAVFAGAWSTVMTRYFGDMAFDATSADAPGVVRHFDSFAQAALEDAESRIFGGVHFQFSAQDGLATGEAVAADVLAIFQKDGLLAA